MSESQQNNEKIYSGEIVDEKALTTVDYSTFAMQEAGQAANQAASHGIFADYMSRRAENTLRRQSTDLRLFSDFLNLAGVHVSDYSLQNSSEAWKGMTWGIIESFKRWMLAEGYAIGSVNVRLSTIKTYAGLAFRAGAIIPDEHALIRTVTGYSHKEGKRVDQKREVIRIGDKKSEPVRISPAVAFALKDQPNTPQGRRDSLLMCLLLDHGLRCSEVAILKTENIDIEDGLLKFYRPKVDKEQIHSLTIDTYNAVHAWFDFGDALEGGTLIRASHKGGKLTDRGMTVRGITKRVRFLGEKLGLYRLGAHDCRHFWATHAARSGTDPFALQEAGGWNSLAMPRRYVESSKIANKDVKGF